MRDGINMMLKRHSMIILTLTIMAGACVICVVACVASQNEALMWLLFFYLSLNRRTSDPEGS